MPLEERTIQTRVMQMIEEETKSMTWLEPYQSHYAVYVRLLKCITVVGLFYVARSAQEYQIQMAKVKEGDVTTLLQSLKTIYDTEAWQLVSNKPFQECGSTQS